MKVRFLKDCHGTHGNFKAGQVADIADAVAGSWVGCGAVEEVQSDPVATETVAHKPDMSTTETASVDRGEKATRKPGQPRRVK